MIVRAPDRFENKTAHTIWFASALRAIASVTLATLDASAITGVTIRQADGDPDADVDDESLTVYHRWAGDDFAARGPRPAGARS